MSLPIVFASGTGNLGDFLNGLPVLSGLNKKIGKYTLMIREQMRKFKGIQEFLMYQDIFEDVVFFDEEVHRNIQCYVFASWNPYVPLRKDRNNPNRPTETCLYENFLKQFGGLEFEVDDDFIVKTPNYDIEIKDEYYVGDRWNGVDIDVRRETQILSYLKDFNFIDFNRPLLENAYIIKNLKKPFITNFTGVGMLADLCNVTIYCVWKPEDWKPEFRNGNDVNWDDGKNIQQVFEKHFYLNRKAKLVHANDLQKLL
jgi:hypothetical protein